MKLPLRLRVRFACQLGKELLAIRLSDKQRDDFDCDGCMSEGEHDPQLPYKSHDAAVACLLLDSWFGNTDEIADPKIKQDLVGMLKYIRTHTFDHNPLLKHLLDDVIGDMQADNDNEAPIITHKRGSKLLQ